MIVARVSEDFVKLVAHGKHTINGVKGTIVDVLISYDSFVTWERIRDFSFYN